MTAGIGIADHNFDDSKTHDIVAVIIIILTTVKFFLPLCFNHIKSIQY